MKIPNPNEDENKKKQSPSFDKSKLWLIIAGIAIVLIGIVAIGGHMTHKNETKPVKTVKVARKIKSKSHSVEHAKSQSVNKSTVSNKSQSSKSQSENKQDKPKADPKPNIEALFNAMYVYDGSKITRKQQAENMLKVSNDDVVNQLMPNTLNDDSKPSFVTVGSLTKPIEIQTDPGADNTYNVTVYSKVSAKNRQDATYEDSYKVIVDNDGKIKQVNPKTMELK